MKLTKKERIEFQPFTPDMIKDTLSKNDDQLKKALLRLFQFQTADERSDEFTKYTNDVGFNGPDSNILSGFAKQYQSKQWLSDKQMVILRKKMLKYSKQLARVANTDYWSKKGEVAPHILAKLAEE